MKDGEYVESLYYLYPSGQGDCTKDPWFVEQRVDSYCPFCKINTVFLNERENPKKGVIQYICSSCNKIKIKADYFGSALYYWVPRYLFPDALYPKIEKVDGRENYDAGFFEHLGKRYFVRCQPDRSKRYD